MTVSYSFILCFEADPDGGYRVTTRTSGSNEKLVLSPFHAIDEEQALRFATVQLEKSILAEFVDDSVRKLKSIVRQTVWGAPEIVLIVEGDTVRKR